MLQHTNTHNYQINVILLTQQNNYRNHLRNIYIYTYIYIHNTQKGSKLNVLFSIMFLVDY